ncbi:MAG: enoyl-CoA hydratase-related protein [Desulfobacterales bacterium]
MKDYREDNDLRCAIITGAGDDVFSSGADLKRLIPLITGARQPETDADKLIKKDPYLPQKAFLRTMKIDKPIIAAINGHAIAGGSEILYATDIRIAAEGARFGLQEVKWSIVLLMGSAVKLPDRFHMSKPWRSCSPGELIDAEEALRLGFINKVVPKSQVMEEAERYATLIAKNGPAAIKAIKQSVQAAIGTAA